MNYFRFFLFALISFIMFNNVSFSKEVAPFAYCCCNKDQCLGGDKQMCCSHSKHPIADACSDDCEGVTMRGDLDNDMKDPYKNWCNNTKNIVPDCRMSLKKNETTN